MNGNNETPVLWWSLVSMMRDISESHYCAGWMLGLEFDLWKMVQGGDRSYGMWPVDEHEIAALKELSEQINGWAFYGDDDDHEKYVPMDRWLEIYASKQQAA